MASRKPRQRLAGSSRPRRSGQRKSRKGGKRRQVGRGQVVSNVRSEARGYQRLVNEDVGGTSLKRRGAIRKKVDPPYAGILGRTPYSYLHPYNVVPYPSPATAYRRGHSGR